MRGPITIIDRKRLEERAGHIPGVPEANYRVPVERWGIGISRRNG